MRSWTRSWLDAVAPKALKVRAAQAEGSRSGHGASRRATGAFTNGPRIELAASWFASGAGG